MEELKKDVYLEAEKYYEKYLFSRTFENASPFLPNGIELHLFCKGRKKSV